MSRFKTAKERRRRRRIIKRRVARDMQANRDKRRAYRVRRKARKAAESRLVPDMLQTTVVWADGKFLEQK